MISFDSALFLAGMAVVLAAVATIEELSAGTITFRKVVWSSAAVALPLLGVSLALWFGSLEPRGNVTLGAIASAPFGLACSIAAACRHEPAPGALKAAGIVINGGVLAPPLGAIAYFAFLYARDGCC